MLHYIMHESEDWIGTFHPNNNTYKKKLKQKDLVYKIYFSVFAFLLPMHHRFLI